MLMTGLLCYVLGCRDGGTAGAVRSVRHRNFGVVTSCARHDPHRCGAGHPIVSALLPRYGLPASGVVPPAGGGTRVPVVPVVPQVPPAPVGLVVPRVLASARGRVTPAAVADLIDPF
jgi:hypothetical protein